MGDTTSSTLYFADAGMLNSAGGIKITDEMVNSVSNPFLDLSKVNDSDGTFYFLADVHYDQIVLEKLYNSIEKIGKLPMELQAAIEALFEFSMRPLYAQDEAFKQKLSEMQSDINNKSAELQNASSELLDLCLLASSPQHKKVGGSIGYDAENREIVAPTDPEVKLDGKYTLASGVKRITNADGTYAYEIVAGDKAITGNQLDKSFSKLDVLAGTTITYYAMAIMYEKVVIQQMILTAQLEEIEKINDEIEYNNKVMSVLSDLYEQIYRASTNGGDEDDPISHPEGYDWVDMSDWEVTSPKLRDYLLEKVGVNDINSDRETVSSQRVAGGAVALTGNRCYFSFAHYNKDGEWQADKSKVWNVENIDVHEQAALNTVSTWQDQVRMYGDKLSTDAQLMTTKMEQYMQNMNASLSVCTQVVKAAGDFSKTVASNIR